VTIIEETALALAERNPGAMKEDVQLAGVPRYVASNKVTLRLDKAGFLIIHPKPESGLLLVEHYKNSGEPTCMIEGSDSAIVCAELIERGLVSQLDHAAYLGRELERAKLAMQLGFPFVQDRALGELDPSTMPEW
jgi:tetrahydromethanopterin S-methyltransferase subunit A